MCFAHWMRQSAHALAHSSAGPAFAPCPVCSAAINRFRLVTLATVAPRASNALRRLNCELDVFIVFGDGFGDHYFAATLATGTTAAPALATSSSCCALFAPLTPI